MCIAGTLVQCMYMYMYVLVDKYMYLYIVLGRVLWSCKELQVIFWVLNFTRLKNVHYVKLNLLDVHVHVYCTHM